MTKIAFVQVKQLACELVPEPNTCKQVLSIALGIAAARLAPLPGAQAERDEQLWEGVRTGVEEMIFTFNEEVVISTPVALEAARAFWLARYNSAYPKSNVPISTLNCTGSFWGVITRVQDYVSPEMHRVTTEHSTHTIQLINRITALFAPEQA